MKIQKGTRSAYKLKICKYCEGSGQVMYNSREDGSLYEECKMCEGSGRIVQFTTKTFKPANKIDLLRFVKIF